MITVIIVVLVILALIAVGLGIDFLALIGILIGLAAVLCFGAWLFAGNEEKRKTLETEEEKAAFDKKQKIKSLVGKLILIAVGVAVVIIIFGGIFGSCDIAFGDSGSSSSSGSSYDSDYDSGYNSGDSGGRFGHGEQYDRDVDYVAGIFYD